ncbi:hypothetical protein [Streptomyces sp. NPDC058202]|uniref:hypothetical protein n=1 Tax=Streptomyces sp. NPDC058202 TaxID=3346380 RepID=UPI0036E8C4C8
MGAATEVDTSSVIAEHRRIERIVSGMEVGDTVVINGTPVTAISLEVADLLDAYDAAAARYRRVAEAGDYEGCEYIRDEMTLHLRRLAAAGHADLIRAV